MMVENSSYWDKIVNGGANDDDFENILSILDFPMESLEGDGLYGDWDSSSQCFGPLPWDMSTQPKYVPPVTPFEINPTPGMKSWSMAHFEDPTCPTIHNQIKSGETQELRQIPVPMVENSARKSLTLKPENVIVPRRTRSKLHRSNSTTPWYLKHPISFTTTGINNEAKREKSSMETINKKCTHCQVTKTPQWREGPLGPKTLCNACGVRYRSGRLYPEYRPAASPTFVPSLHSNSHKKVVEMRNKGKQLVTELGCFQQAN